MPTIFHFSSSIFSTKYPLLTPQTTTFPGVDFGKHFYYYKEHLTSNKIASYKSETIIYLRFSIFQRFFLLKYQF